MRKFFIIILLLLIFFSINLATAGLTDRVVYDEEKSDLAFEVKSWWGFFEWLGIDQTIVKGELTSHKSISEIKQVGLGWQRVMEYELEAPKENLGNILGDIKFINGKDGKEVDKDYYLVYKFQEERTREVCLEYEVIKNDTKIEDLKEPILEQKPQCLNLTNETYTFTEWREYNSKDLLKGNITLGLMVYNEQGDYLDGVWSFSGKEITKHAYWEASLDNGLISYYKMEETSGSTMIDSYGSNNGTYYNNLPESTTGIIDNGQSFQTDGTGDYANLGNFLNSSADFTINFWIKPNSSPGTYARIMSYAYDDNNKFHVLHQSSTEIIFRSTFGGSNKADQAITSVPSNDWTMVTLVVSSNTPKIYKNAVQGGETSVNGGAGSSDFLIADNGAGTRIWKGEMDELALWDRVLTDGEVELLYSDRGPPCFECYEPSPAGDVNVTLIEPVDYYNSSSTSIDFGCNASSETANLVSLELFINGSSYDEVTNAGATFLEVDTTETLSDGFYSWYCNATTNASEVTQSSVRYLTVDTIDPTLTATINETILYAEGETILLNTTATDANLDKVWYSYNGTNATITGAKTGVLNQTTITTILTALEIIVYANDTLGNTATPVTLTLIVDPTTPTITLNYPTALIDYGKLNGTLQLNFTATDSNLDSVWYDYRDIIYTNYSEGNFYFTNIDNLFDNNRSSTIGGGGAFNKNAYIEFNFTEFTKSNTYKVNLSRSDFLVGNYEYEYDIPSTCSNYYKDKLRLRLKGYTNVILGGWALECFNGTWNEIGSGSPIEYFYYIKITDGTEEINRKEIVGAVSGVANISNITLSTKKNITIYANDTLGNLNTTLFSWDYKVFENSQEFSPTTLSGLSETYTLNITLGENISLTSATLIYSGEEHVGSIYSYGLNRTIIVENLEVPVFSTDTNVSFYWVLEVTGTTVTTENETQLVQSIALDNCSSYTYRLFNLSLFDEETKESLNGTIELNYNLLSIPSYEVIANQSMEVTGVSTTEVCSELDIYGENILYSAEIRYLSEGYVPELYYIQRGEIMENGTSINLYDLNSNSSTEFKIIYQDDSFNFVEGAIVQLMRKYISEDLYEVVEAPLTSRDGTAVVHIDLNSIKYKAVIVKNGVVLDTFENLVFKCESELTGECEQKLLGEINPQNEINYDDTRDFAYTISEENNTITTTFTIPNGVPSTVNIQLEQKDQFGNTTLCNQTIISSAGSIECNYFDTIGDSYVLLNIYKDGEPMAIKSYIIREESGLDFLNNNFFIVIVLLLSLVGMAISSPEWIIVNAIVTLLISGALQLVNGVNFVMGLGSLMWLVVGAGILIFKLAKQEDR